LCRPSVPRWGRCVCLRFISNGHGTALIEVYSFLLRVNGPHMGVNEIAPKDARRGQPRGYVESHPMKGPADLEVQGYDASCEDSFSAGIRDPR
jgi:hypothetical protein